MIRKISMTFGMALATLYASAPSWAHHGAGVFEPEKMVTVVGTVAEFQFVNPHVLVYINVKGDDGKEVRWGGELTSPNRLARMNSGGVQWSKDILKPGDRITMTGHPARNGAPAMDIEKIVDAKGVALIGGD
jgi:hypothetical protein